MTVAARHGSEWGFAPHAARHAAVWSIRQAASARHGCEWCGLAPVAARHAAGLAGMAAVSVRHAGAYAGHATVAARHVGSYRGRSVVSTRHAVRFDGMDSVSVRHVGTYAGRATVAARHAESHGGRLLVSTRHSGSYAGLTIVSGRHAATWKLPSPVGARHAFFHTLLGFNPVEARHASAWASPDAEIVIVTGETYLLHGAIRIELGEDTVVSADEGSPAWIATLDVIEEADFARVRVGDPLTLVLWDHEVALICDGRRLSRGDGEPRFVLSGISPIAAFGSPFAQPVMPPLAGLMARAAVESLLGEIDWGLPNWVLPAVQIEASPLEIARQIAAATGGVIESNPDGTVRARRLYPVPVPEYGAQSLDALTDRDVLAQSDSAAAVSIENRFVITSVGGASTESIQVEAEQDEDDPHAYTVRAYPWPFRAVELVHTGDAATQIGAREQVVTPHEELIEVVSGAANASYPIDAVIAAEYQHVDLGAVRTDGSVVTTATTEYSQIALQYRARAWAWRVTNARIETIQFLAVE